MMERAYEANGMAPGTPGNPVGAMSAQVVKGAQFVVLAPND